ncbi:hypothetical protein FN846DRAFT_11491 [Sphaerosporella brunnea]|uniref:Uncharacterized protein n=1 Tax=Sphaerosporella brunnea TaxID=1250544 RepID=A0A5J5EWW1_9PEZI|nr:hypothetical protein FN846DRAFT_11491 [Sphaerosporella brunnea]
MTDRIAAFAPINMTCIASALADSLWRFVDELPDAAREVRGVISTLFEIKTLLAELDGQFVDARFNRLSRELLDDIAMGIGSCSSSLKDLDGIVLRCSMTRRGSSPRSARKSWNEILSSFRNIEGSSLQARLEVHRIFLFHVAGLLRNLFGPSYHKKSEQKAEIRRLQDQIRALAIQQEKSEARMREAEEVHRRTVEEQAYRSRYQPSPPMPPVSTPPHDSPPRRPYSTPLPSPPFPLPIDSYRFMPPAGTIHENRPMTPVSPISPISPITPLTTPPMSQRRYSVTPAPALSRPPATPPMTPPTSHPAARRGHPQLPTKGSSEYWWSRVFGMSPGSTSLSEPPKQSQCYGLPMDTLSMAAEEHEIFRVEFDGDLMLRMFRNEVTEEAKVVSTRGGNGASWASGRRNGYLFQTVINASKLDIARVGPGVQLTRRNLVWASLYFADFETMTLFYHAFLALRSQSPSAPIPRESEYWLDGESLMFSAKIDNDGYIHALRLLKDRDSGCIRLAAAKAEGEQDVTVWTAFITHQICQSNWLSYSQRAPNCVRMKNIRQFSFSSSFETNMWRDFELRFLQDSDAIAFTHAINSEFMKMIALRDEEYSAPAPPARPQSAYAAGYHPTTPGTVLRDSYF